MNNIKYYLTAFFGIILIGIFAFFGPNIYRHFGTRYEDSRRHIYEKSLSYKRGVSEHLERLKLEYELSEKGNHRSAIRETVLTTISSIDINSLPDHLQIWIQELRRSE